MATPLRSALMSRSYIFPEPGDTVTTIAGRVFPGDEGAAKRMLSWNLHLVTRRSLNAEPPGANGDPGALLCTDIVYVEAPQPR